MSSTTLKNLSYRTFDSLITEVYNDLPSYARENMIEPAQLIKVAQKINYELGLKIYKTKETILELEHGRAKLPADFYILNLALLCHHYIICEPGLFNGLHTENVAIPITNPLTVPQLTTCPCWQITNPTDRDIQVKYTNCSGKEIGITFLAGITTKLCAAIIPNETGLLEISTVSFCYNDPDTGNFSCNPFPVEVDCGCDTPVINECAVVNADPWLQNKVFTTCNGTMQVNVIEYNSYETRRYENFETIHIVPSKEATAFCVNTNFKNCRHQGNIRDGFLYVPTIRHHNQVDSVHRVYICYLGSMEDDDGNLLVLDHPKINEFYELSLSERIFRNIYLNGEPDMENRYKLLKSDLKTCRAECLSIAATPDFNDLRRCIEDNRKATYAKYIHQFSSLWSNTPYGFNSDYI